MPRGACNALRRWEGGGGTNTMLMACAGADATPLSPLLNKFTGVTGKVSEFDCTQGGKERTRRL